jgi:hypothetical protein
MKTTPTDLQNNEAIAILVKTSRDGFTCKLVTPEQRDTTTQDSERQWWILPAFIVDNQYWCGWDVYYGHNIVVNLNDGKSYTAKNEIVTDDFVFVSDYHGYSNGAFYYASK